MILLQATLDAYIKASAAQQAAMMQRLTTLEQVLAQLHPAAAVAFAPSSAMAGVQTSLPGSMAVAISSPAEGEADDGMVCSVPSST
jgi:hypothetical protein